MPEMQISTRHRVLEIALVLIIIASAIYLLSVYLDMEKFLKQSRDARRIGDMLTLQTALLSALAANELSLVSCLDCASLTGNTNASGSGWLRFVTKSDNPLSLEKLPLDPKNSGENAYYFYSDGQKFELNTYLESEAFSGHALNDGGNDPKVYERGLKLDLK